MKKLLFVVVFLFACGEVDEIPGNGGGGGTPEPPVIEEPQNPTCDSNNTSFDGTGNLWKPEAEGGGSQYGGNPVLLLSSVFKRQFDSCVVELKGGGSHELTCVDDAPWTFEPFSCFANGNRQHMRSELKAERIKNRARIECKDNQQICVFILPGRATDRHG